MDFAVNLGLFFWETGTDFVMWSVAIYISLFFIAAEFLGLKTVYPVLLGHHVITKIRNSIKRRRSNHNTYYEDA